MVLIIMRLFFYMRPPSTYSRRGPPNRTNLFYSAHFLIFSLFEVKIIDRKGGEGGRRG